MKAILLGAGQGRRLRPLTDDRPKCMVDVAGHPLLHWQLSALRAAGIDDISVVRGWCRTAIHGRNLRFIDNPRWDQTNMVESLRCAISELSGEVLIAYTDILYDTRVVQAARQSNADIGVIVDLQWRSLWESRMEDPLADAETLRFDDTHRLLEIGQKPGSIEEIQAQYIGMVRLSAAGCETLRDTLNRAVEARDRGQSAFGSERSLDDAYLTDLLMSLITDQVPVKAIPIEGGWTEIDAPDDIPVAEALIKARAWAPPLFENMGSVA